MLAFGHGWVKVGYRFVEEEVEGESEISEANPDGIGHPNTIVREDSPFAERVSVNDIFVDPDATSMKDIKWIAQRIRRPIADVAVVRQPKMSVASGRTRANLRCLYRFL